MCDLSWARCTLYKHVLNGVSSVLGNSPLGKTSTPHSAAQRGQLELNKLCSF